MSIQLQHKYNSFKTPTVENLIKRGFGSPRSEIDRIKKAQNEARAKANVERLRNLGAKI